MTDEVMKTNEVAQAQEHEDILTSAILSLQDKTLSQIRTSTRRSDTERELRYEKAITDIRKNLGDAVFPLSEKERDNDLKTKLTPEQLPAFQIAIKQLNPVAPYELELSKENVIFPAYSDLGSALGWDEDWAKDCSNCIRRAREEIQPRPAPWLVPIVVVGSIAAIIGTAGLAAPVVAGIGGAGLAGGAAIVSGLATLGMSGGMAGGLAVLVGGGAAVGAGVSSLGHTLANQSKENIGTAVIDLMASALRAKHLGLKHPGITETKIVAEAQAEAYRQKNNLMSISDSNSQGLKEIENRIKVLNKAADWMVKNGVWEMS